MKKNCLLIVMIMSSFAICQQNIFAEAIEEDWDKKSKFTTKEFFIYNPDFPKPPSGPRLDWQRFNTYIDRRIKKKEYYATFASQWKLDGISSILFDKYSFGYIHVGALHGYKSLTIESDYPAKFIIKYYRKSGLWLNKVQTETNVSHRYMHHVNYLFPTTNLIKLEIEVYGPECAEPYTTVLSKDYFKPIGDPVLEVNLEVNEDCKYPQIGKYVYFIATDWYFLSTGRNPRFYDYSRSGFVISFTTKKEKSVEKKKIKNAVETDKENSNDLESKLIELKNLYEKGLVTENEYNKLKNELLKKHFE